MKLNTAEHYKIIPIQKIINIIIFHRPPTLQSSERSWRNEAAARIELGIFRGAVWSWERRWWAIIIGKRALEWISCALVSRKASSSSAGPGNRHDRVLSGVITVHQHGSAGSKDASKKFFLYIVVLLVGHHIHTAKTGPPFNVYREKSTIKNLFTSERER
jgi:hypothetical protein